MGYYWLLCSLLVDVTAMAVEADVERVLCSPHILQLALNEVDDIPHFTGGCGSHMGRVACDGTSERLSSLDVLTSH